MVASVLRPTGFHGIRERWESLMFPLGRPLLLRCWAMESQGGFTPRIIITKSSRSFLVMEVIGQSEQVRLVLTFSLDWIQRILTSAKLAIAPTTNHQIGAGITCIANSNYLSVLVVTSENQYVYYIWNGSWSGPHPIATTIGFSAATCIMLNSEIHTYFQQIGGHVIECTSDSAGGNFRPDKTDVPVH